MSPEQTSEPAVVHYPESDGKPLADNSIQRRWIVAVHGNIDDIYGDEDEVCVQMDMLWYSEEGNNKLSIAPDVFVAYGRPRGDRRSYQQWKEGGVAPQVVFEVLSHCNTPAEMLAKREFYEKYGVEEYYLIEPDTPTCHGWRRSRKKLVPIKKIDGWVSPRLGVRFDLSTGDVTLYRPDGTRFLTFEEMARSKRLSDERLREQTERLSEETRRADRAEEDAARERQARERLAARLRALGIGPDTA